MKKLKQIIYHWIDQRFLDGCTNYNSLAVRKAARTKKSSRQMFAKLNVPYAKGSVFFSPVKAFRFVRKHGYPVVIKPDVSGFSRGSHFPIRTNAELLKACLAVKIWWPTTVIEQYLEGHNYRVVVIDGEVMGVIERYCAFVIGDGKASVRQLVETENTIRLEMELPPVMHLLSINAAVKKMLRQQGLSVDAVPDQDQWVTLQNKVALKPGGVVETLDPEKIHPDNRALCLSLLKGFDANILGIDLIMSDSIEKSHQQQDCIFLEVNTRPYLKMHHYPRFGSKPDLEPSYQRLEQLNISDADTF